MQLIKRNINLLFQFPIILILEKKNKASDKRRLDLKDKKNKNKKNKINFLLNHALFQIMFLVAIMKQC